MFVSIGLESLRADPFFEGGIEQWVSTWQFPRLHESGEERPLRSQTALLQVLTTNPGEKAENSKHHRSLRTSSTILPRQNLDFARGCCRGCVQANITITATFTSERMQTKIIQEFCTLLIHCRSKKLPHSLTVSDGKLYCRLV